MGLFNNFWPKFTDIESVKRPIKFGAYASCGLMILSIVLAIIEYPKIDESLSMLIYDATLWAIIAIGIFFRKSRAASIFGLFRFALGTIIEYINTGNVFGTYLLTIVLTLIFIGCVRGTFYYHKFRKSSIHRKDFIILNLLALLYSSVATFSALLIFNHISNETNEIFFLYVAVCLGIIIYFLTLIRKMPLTKNRVIVTYSIPEGDLKNSAAGETPSEQIIDS
jgi:uncharacterized membrane protein